MTIVDRPPAPATDASSKRLADAMAQLSKELGCSQAGAEALRGVVSALVDEGMDAVWQKGKSIAAVQRDHASKIRSLLDDLAACRAECQELRCVVRRLCEGTCAEYGSTASSVSSPETKDGSEWSSPEYSPSLTAATIDRIPTPPPLPSGSRVGVAAAAAAATAVASPASNMPELLQLSPALPSVMPYPFGHPHAFLGLPAHQAMPQLPMGEQRPLSLADALAGELPCAPPASSPVVSLAASVAQPVDIANNAMALASVGTLGIEPDGVSASDKRELAEEAPAPAREVFTLTLEKDGASLGLNVSHEDSERTLFVEGIFPGSAAEAWNNRCSATGERTVCVGDRIVAINGIAHDPEQMLQECRNREVLTLTILREACTGLVVDPSTPSVCMAASAKSASARQLRAEASVFVPGSAVVAPEGVDQTSGALAGDAAGSA
mmetsp:Transcript_122319/g.351419  ORF Transcript_122319/g.351419 Transcript_122319/m.351419 type:complete len:437 (+) Transcript_122319:72-1382(+)